jgi:hypothetical protein
VHKRLVQSVCLAKYSLFCWGKLCLISSDSAHARFNIFMTCALSVQWRAFFGSTFLQVFVRVILCNVFFPI